MEVQQQPQDNLSSRSLRKSTSGGNLAGANRHPSLFSKLRMSNKPQARPALQTSGGVGKGAAKFPNGSDTLNLSGSSYFTPSPASPSTSTKDVATKTVTLASKPDLLDPAPTPTAAPSLPPAAATLTLASTIEPSTQPDAAANSPAPAPAPSPIPATTDTAHDEANLSTASFARSAHASMPATMGRPASGIYNANGANGENNFGISSIRNNFAARAIHLADENIVLKKQLNSLLRDKADLMEKQVDLTDQSKSLKTENGYLTNTLTTMKDELKEAEESKLVLEKRSYALNDLLDTVTDNLKVTQTENETLINDLAKCRIQKSTLLNQFSKTLDEVSQLGLEISAVKEKNYNLLQQLAAITSPSPAELVRSLEQHNFSASPAPPYFQLHQFRRFKQKRQLLQEAVACADPFVLRDIVLTLRVGLADHTFAELIAPFPEARELYISHAMSLGRSHWPSLLSMLSYFNLPYEEGMLRLKLALTEPEVTSRLISLHACVAFFMQHECLRWECERLLEHINTISD